MLPWRACSSKRVMKNTLKKYSENLKNKLGSYKTTDTFSTDRVKSNFQ